MKSLIVLLSLAVSLSSAYAQPRGGGKSKQTASKRIATKKSSKRKTSKRRTTQNWAKTIKAQPKKIHRPRTKSGLLRTLKNSKGRIRFGGSMHSWSAGPQTNDTLIDMRSLGKVLKVDKKKLEVTVEAGIEVKKLYKFLDDNGLALDMIPSSGEITLAGALANAVHGAGVARKATLSDHVVAMEYAKTDGSGTVNLTTKSKVAGAKTLNDLQLGRTSLGSVGALYAVTVKVVPKYDVLVKRRNMSEKEVIPNFKKITQENDHALFFWYPAVNGFHVQTYKHVALGKSRQMQRKGTPFKTTPKETKIDMELTNDLAQLSQMPNGTKLFQKLVSTGPEREETVLSPWWIGPREASTIAPHDVSYAIDPAKIQKTMKELKSYFKKVGWPPIELWIRYAGKSDSAMSPAFEGPKVMIEFFPMQQVGTPAQREKLMAGARAIFERNGGLRHWAKEGTGGMEKRNPAHVADFQRLRTAIDPGKRLAGEYTQSIGLDPKPVAKRAAK